MDSEASEYDYHAFAQFGFCNVGVRHEFDLGNVLILYNQSTVNLLFHKKLFKKFLTTDYSMAVRGNCVAIKTSLKSYVKSLW